MKKFALRNLVLLLCLTMAISLTGCASEAKKAMDESVDTANELLEKDAEPFDAETETALEKAVKTSEEAEDDDAYKKVKKDIDNAIKAYQDSVKQQKQVTERKKNSWWRERRPSKVLQRWKLPRKKQMRIHS